MGLISMRLMDEIGKKLLHVLIFGLVSLVLVQGLMTEDRFRFYLSLGERLEGQKVPVSTAMFSDEDLIEEIPCSTSSPGSFSLSLQSYSSLEKARLLINGQEIGRMSSNRIELYVTSGDVIEIDTLAYDHPVTLKVTNVTPNLTFPQEGMLFTSHQALSMLGKIQVR